MISVPFYDPRLLRIYRWGGLLSLSGLVFGLAGVWQPGPVRWLAPVCYLGTALFWFASASAPYPILYRVEGKQQRAAVDDDLSDPAVLSRKAKLQWERG